MAIEVAIAVSIGAEAAGTALQLEGQSEAESAQKNALDQRMLQIEISTTNEMVNRDNELHNLLSTQTAESAARGLSPQSASFGAITWNTFDNFATDRNAELLNERFKIGAITQQKDELESAARLKRISTIFGGIANVAGTLVSAGTAESEAAALSGASAGAPVVTARPSPLVGGRPRLTDLTQPKFFAGEQSFDISNIISTGNAVINDQLLE